MQFLQDLRVACRSLLRTPAFTALATGVLGLGLAVVVTMFGILYTIAYAPPPFPEPESLVGVHIIDRARDNFEDGTNTHQLADWRAAQTSFEEIGGGLVGTVIISGDGAAERYSGGMVTGTLFDVIGIKPLIGRGVQESDAVAGASPVVVLGYDLWRTRYHSDRDIIGRALKVNGELSTVVGVMPEVLDFPNSAQLWVPLREKLDEIPRGKGAWVQVVARLRPGVTLEASQAELSAISARLAERYPETNAGLEPDVLPIAAAQIGREDLRLFHMLFASVFLVLIIAAVNVAGLMLVRATTRTQEASVRRALGAGRARLVAQMLTESLVIGSVAALVGLTLGAACLEVLSGILTATIEDLPKWWNFAVDGRVAVFAVAVGVLSTLVAGLFPALRVAGVDINGVLRDGTRDTGLSTGRIIRWLVVVEIALSCALLTSAGIMVRIAIEASTSDLGVDVRPFMTGRVGLPEAAYPEDVRTCTVHRATAGTRAGDSGRRRRRRGHRTPGTRRGPIALRAARSLVRLAGRLSVRQRSRGHARVLQRRRRARDLGTRFQRGGSARVVASGACERNLRAHRVAGPERHRPAYPAQAEHSGIRVAHCGRRGGRHHARRRAIRGQGRDADCVRTPAAASGSILHRDAAHRRRSARVRVADP